MAITTAHSTEIIGASIPAGEAVLVAKTLEDALRGVLLLAMLVLAIPRSHSSMNPVKPSSFGRRTGAVRRYPGGTENSSIFLTLSRETPKWRAAARSLIPSRHARRTLRYSSTV